MAGKGGRTAWVDYSDEMHIHANPMLRIAYLALGLASVGLGVLGYLLPGLPGTVFLLLAAFFFAQSSPRLYNRLMNHRVFGPLVRDVRAGRGVPLWVKIYAPLMIVLFAGTSCAYLASVRGWPWLAFAVAAAGATGIWVVLRQPTRSAPDPEADAG